MCECYVDYVEAVIKAVGHGLLTEKDAKRITRNLFNAKPGKFFPSLSKLKEIHDKMKG